MRHVPILLMALTALGIGGCAGFTKDGGFGAVADATRVHLGKDLNWPRSPQEQSKVDAQVAQLLGRSLSAEDAVQIALLNNHALQASFQELKVSEADLVQAGRLPNPRFDLRHAAAGGQYDIEETLSFNVLSLLTMPYVRDIEQKRLARTQDAVILQVARLAGETREAFYAALAARESHGYLEQVCAAAETSATLAERMVKAGNWNSLDLARERAFYSESVQALTRARLAELSSREKLMNLMGLPKGPDAEPAMQLAASLPPLPPSLEDLPDVERVMLSERLDLKLMRARIDELRERLKLDHGTRFINVLDAGATRVRQGAGDAPYESGYTVTLEVPIFDSGAARIGKSEAVYAQAVDRFTQAALEARSQIRRAYAATLASFEIAKQQHDEVLPLRQAIARENLRRYNASQISIFELLSDAREQAGSVDGYIQSLRDFWTAKSQLDSALLGNSAQ